MSNEFGSFSLSYERELLNAKAKEANESVNSYMHAQWDVVRDGLWNGVSERGREAKDNPLLTGLEIASAAGIAGGMVKAFGAGGRWRLGAEVAGVAFGAMMGVDIFRRGSAIHDVYASTNADAIGNTQRENAIAKYAGTGIFDYSLVFASAGLGLAGALRSGRPASAKPELSTTRAAEPAALLERKPLEESIRQRNRLMDVDKVVEDLAFSLDYQISETAMSKISETLRQANREDFNAIVQKLADKDRRMQGMDLYLGNWLDVPKRWDTLKLYHTDENMITHQIVQKGDTTATIAEFETAGNPRRAPNDIKAYENALIKKNNITDPNNLEPGRILVLPFAG